ncbi:MAG: VWA domain-containing protein [Syntrophobacter sp.]
MLAYFLSRTFLRSVLIASVFILLTPFSQNAQNMPTTGTDAQKTQIVVNQVDISGFPNVILFVSVLDPGGKPNLGLSPQDFSLKEDEVDQSPVSVRTQLPSIASALVLDSSGSMKNAMADAQRAATTFIDNSKKDDDLLLIDFSDTVKVVQRFTSDKQALRNAIRAMKARGNTALYDAIYEATQTIGEKKGRKVIIVLTDGMDDNGMNQPLSVKTVEQVIAAANVINVPVFTVGLGKSVDETVLRKIAQETGGRYFLSPAPADLEKMYMEISAQLEGQYVLSYTTNLAEPDGSWHRVVIAAREGFGQKQYQAPLRPAELTKRPQVQEEAKMEAKPVEAGKAEDKPKINVLELSQGTKVLYATSQYDNSEWAAKNLIDGKIGKGHGYAASSNVPQEILFELPKTAMISGAVLDPFTVESENNWAKDVELWVSTTDPHGQFSKVTGFTLSNTRLISEDPAFSLTEQSFSFEPTRAKWVRVLMKSNYGGSYMELGEIKLDGYFTEEESPPGKLVNLLTPEAGGKLVYATAQYDDTTWAARNLIDGKLAQGHGYATPSTQPQEIVFSLPKASKITQFAFNPFTTESPNNWAKEVEVEVSMEGPRQGFKSVGKFNLHNKLGIDSGQPLPDQVFKVDPVQARFIKLRLISSHGGSYIEMGEFGAFGPAE